MSANIYFPQQQQKLHAIPLFAVMSCHETIARAPNDKVSTKHSTNFHKNIKCVHDSLQSCMKYTVILNYQWIMKTETHS